MSGILIQILKVVPQKKFPKKLVPKNQFFM